MSFEKENFLRTKLIRYLQQLDPATPPRWGDMNVHQMIEHYADEEVLALADEKKVLNAVQNGDSVLHQQRVPRFKTIQAAINALQEELIHFFEHSDNHTYQYSQNSVSRLLNFEEKVQLLYEHALDNLKRFGVEPMER